MLEYISESIEDWINDIIITCGLWAYWSILVLRNLVLEIIYALHTWVPSVLNFSLIFRCQWRLKSHGYVICFEGTMCLSCRWNLLSKFLRNIHTRMMSNTPRRLSVSCILNYGFQASLSLSLSLNVSACLICSSFLTLIICFIGWLEASYGILIRSLYQSFSWWFWLQDTVAHEFSIFCWQPHVDFGRLWFRHSN